MLNINSREIPFDHVSGLKLNIQDGAKVGTGHSFGLVGAPKTMVVLASTEYILYILP